MSGQDTENERERWNKKYREPRSPSSLIPDEFLPWAFAEFVVPLFPSPGSALDLAGGAGRHSIWLVQQGWKVTLMDISETGVEQARQNAGALATHIHFVVDDLTQFQASQTQYDLVLVLFYLDRGIFSEIIKALRPGGLLLCKTYTIAQADLAKGPRNRAHLLRTSELLSLSRGLSVLHYEEQSSETATAELVAKKETM